MSFEAPPAAWWRRLPWRSIGLWVAAAVACGANVWFVYFAPIIDRISELTGRGHLASFFGAGPPYGLIGGGVDQWGTLWVYDFTYRLLSGDASTFLPELFAPVGLDQAATQGFAWLDAMLAYPLMASLGHPGFLNLNHFLVLALTQLASVALFRSLRAPWLVALALSMVVVDNGFIQTEVFQGRITQAHLMFHALFLLFAWRLVSDGGRWLRDGLLAGLMLGLACLVYWFSAVAVGLAGGLAVLIALAMRPSRWRVAVPGGLVLTVAALAVAIPPAWPLVAQLLSGDDEALVLMDTMVTTVAVGPLSLSVPGDVAATFADWGEVWTKLYDFLAYPRAAVWVGLLSMAALPAWRRVLPWALAGWLLFTMPLGSVITVGDDYVLTAFGAAHWFFPPMARCNFPHRMMVSSIFALTAGAAVASGWLWAWAAPRWREARRAIPLVGVVLVALAVGSNVSRSQPKTNKSASNPFPHINYYLDITTRYPGGIIDLPLEKSNETFIYQTVHRQPLLGGPGITGPNTQPQEHRAYVEGNSLLSGLETLCASGGATTLPWSRADLVTLWSDGFRVIALHPNACRVSPAAVASYIGATEYTGVGEAAIPLPDPATISGRRR